MIISTAVAIVSTGCVAAGAFALGVYANEKGFVSWDELYDAGYTAADSASYRLRGTRLKRPQPEAGDEPPMLRVT